MWIQLILILLVIVTAVVSYIIRNNKKAEVNRYYGAAQKIIKESCLDGAIKNNKQQWNQGMKIMVYLKWKAKPKQEYVFDPEKVVKIGRSLESNDVCIRDILVSAEHCRIFIYQGQLIIQDLNSSNGTWLKRGLHKEIVRGSAPLLSGDKLMIGNEKIDVTVFYFDLAFL
ncbi:MAG: FHA domain-containing protein [Hespellia sp.]|nr:FHA domain-containing protein [Hespellia sp.]